MKDIRLIASDMDHTLLTEQGALPPGFHALVKQLNEAGITFVAASGRPLATLRNMFPQGGPGIAYIGDNGGIVFLDGQALFTSVMQPAAYQEMAARTLAETSGVPIVCGVDASYALTRHRAHEPVLRHFYHVLEFVDSLTDLDVEAVKFTAYVPGEDAFAQRDAVFAPAYGDDFSVTVGSHVWVDIMNRGVTKGVGMRRLAEHFALEPHQMMAFGDMHNDLEMLDAVHHSYAVSNADPLVRERARHITGSNDEHGVVRVIEQVLATRA